MAPGYRAVWETQQSYEWFYIYGAIEPCSGRSVFWLLPALDKASVQFFLEQLRQEVAGEVALVWDGAGAHRAMAKEMPEKMTSVLLPAYCPELNPVEGVWRMLRKKLANRVFDTLKQLEAAVIEALKAFWQHPEVLISLTAFPWWRRALK